MGFISVVLKRIPKAFCILGRPLATNPSSSSSRGEKHLLKKPFKSPASDLSHSDAQGKGQPAYRGSLLS